MPPAPKPRPGDLSNPDVTVPVEPVIRSCPCCRSADRLCAVVGALDVTGPRYAPRDTSGDGKRDTHCDRFVGDVADAMGCVIPQSWRGRELSANGTIDWLAGDGAGYEWAPVVEHQAAAFADRGCLVIACWRNSDGSGHVAVVLPSPLGGPLRIAQAGASCFFDRSIREGFGDRPVIFFAHA